MIVAASDFRREIEVLIADSRQSESTPDLEFLSALLWAQTFGVSIGRARSRKLRDPH